MNGLRKFVRWLKHKPYDDNEYVQNPDGTYGRSLLDDIPIRFDPRIEDDERYMEQVLSAPDNEWLSEPPPDGMTWGEIADRALPEPLRAGDTLRLPDGRTYTARVDLDGEVFFRPDD